MRSRFFRRSAAFSLLEVMIALAIIGLIAGAGIGSVRIGRRLAQDQLGRSMAAALDRSQLDYLAKHPGGSLRDAAAAEEIPASIRRILYLDTPGAVRPQDKAAYEAMGYQVWVRPASVKYLGQTYTFPVVTKK